MDKKKATLGVLIFVGIITLTLIIVYLANKVTTNELESQAENFLISTIKFEPDVKDAFEAESIDRTAEEKLTYCNYQEKRLGELGIDNVELSLCKGINPYGTSVLAKWRTTNVDIKDIKDNTVRADIQVSYDNWDTVLTAPEEFNQYTFSESNHVLNVKDLELIYYDDNGFELTKESKDKLGQLYIGWDRKDYVFVDLEKNEVVQLFN